MLRKISKKLLLSTTVSSFVLGISVNATNTTPVPSSSTDEASMQQAMAAAVVDEQAAATEAEVSNFEDLQNQQESEKRTQLVKNIKEVFNLENLSEQEIYAFLYLSNDQLAKNRLRLVKNALDALGIEYKNTKTDAVEATADDYIFPEEACAVFPKDSWSGVNKIIRLLKLPDKKLNAAHEKLAKAAAKKFGWDNLDSYMAINLLSLSAQQLSDNHMKLVNAASEEFGWDNLDFYDIISLLSLSYEELTVERIKLASAAAKEFGFDNPDIDQITKLLNISDKELAIDHVKLVKAASEELGWNKPRLYQLIGLIKLSDDNLQKDHVKLAKAAADALGVEYKIQPDYTNLVPLSSVGTIPSYGYFMPVLQEIKSNVRCFWNDQIIQLLKLSRDQLTKDHIERAKDVSELLNFAQRGDVNNFATFGPSTVLSPIYIRPVVAGSTHQVNPSQSAYDVANVEVVIGSHVWIRLLSLSGYQLSKHHVGLVKKIEKEFEGVKLGISEIIQLLRFSDRKLTKDHMGFAKLVAKEFGWNDPEPYRIIQLLDIFGRWLTKDHIESAVKAAKVLGFINSEIHQLMTFLSLSGDQLSEGHVNKVKALVKKLGLNNLKNYEVTQLLSLSDKELDSTHAETVRKVAEELGLKNFNSLELLQMMVFLDKDLTDNHAQLVRQAVETLGWPLSEFNPIIEWLKPDEGLPKGDIELAKYIVENFIRNDIAVYRIVRLFSLPAEKLSNKHVQLVMGIVKEFGWDKLKTGVGTPRICAHEIIELMWLPDEKLSKNHVDLVKKIVNKFGSGNLEPGELVNLLSLSDKELKERLGEDSQVDEDFDSSQVTTLEESADMV